MRKGHIRVIFEQYVKSIVSHVFVMVSELRRFVIQLLRKWLCILKPKLTFLVYGPNIVQKQGVGKIKQRLILNYERNAQYDII